MKKAQGDSTEILKRRRQVLERIREKMPSEAAALEALDMALEVVGASAGDTAGPYAEVKRGIDAIVMHLTKHGAPMERRQLVTEVVAGGWSAGDPLAYMRLWDVIRHQWTAAKSPVLARRKDGKVALAKGAGKGEQHGR